MNFPSKKSFILVKLVFRNYKSGLVVWAILEPYFTFTCCQQEGLHGGVVEFENLPQRSKFLSLHLRVVSRPFTITWSTHHDHVGACRLRRFSGMVATNEWLWCACQSGVKPTFSGPGFVLALAGIRRLVVHIKAIETDDLIPL